MAELDIEKLKSCTAIKQIPILTLDERWYQKAIGKDKNMAMFLVLLFEPCEFRTLLTYFYL